MPSSWSPLRRRQRFRIPAGSGKITYIGKYVPLVARENGVDFISLNVDGDFLSQCGLHHCLGIPKT
jgi:hypothetical protein